MKKIIYLVGIYGVCITIHEVMNYFAAPVNASLKRRFRKHEEALQKEERRNKSKNLTTGEVGNPINRIGF